MEHRHQLLDPPHLAVEHLAHMYALQQKTSRSPTKEQKLIISPSKKIKKDKKSASRSEREKATNNN